MTDKPLKSQDISYDYRRYYDDNIENLIWHGSEGKGRCIHPEKHNNGDKHSSMGVNSDTSKGLCRVCGFKFNALTFQQAKYNQTKAEAIEALRAYEIGYTGDNGKQKGNGKPTTGKIKSKFSFRSITDFEPEGHKYVDHVMFDKGKKTCLKATYAKGFDEIIRVFVKVADDSYEARRYWTLPQIRKNKSRKGYPVDRMHRYEDGDPPYLKAIHKGVDKEGKPDKEAFFWSDIGGGVYISGIVGQRVLFMQRQLADRSGDDTHYTEGEKDKLTLGGGMVFWQLRRVGWMN